MENLRLFRSVCRGPLLGSVGHVEIDLVAGLRGCIAAEAIIVAVFCVVDRIVRSCGRKLGYVGLRRTRTLGCAYVIVLVGSRKKQKAAYPSRTQVNKHTPPDTPAVSLSARVFVRTLGFKDPWPGSCGDYKESNPGNPGQGCQGHTSDTRL